jgi:hypothetical protein
MVAAKKDQPIWLVAYGHAGIDPKIMGLGLSGREAL